MVISVVKMTQRVEMAKQGSWRWKRLQRSTLALSSVNIIIVKDDS